MEVIEIKQKDNWSCAACVAAMITGETLQDIIDSVGHDGSAKDIKTTDNPDGYRGFSDYDIAQYLMSRGYRFGCLFDVHNQKDIQDFLLGKRDLSIDSIRQGNWEIGCLITVESSNINYHHAIYWDGENIWDPSPSVDSTKRTLEDYKILQVTPISKYEYYDLIHWKHRHEEVVEPIPDADVPDIELVKEGYDPKSRVNSDGK